MKKRVWKRIRVRPNKILIALILVTSLMGMSYGAWSDQLNISGSITIAKPEPPPTDPDDGIMGELMIHNSGDYYIKGAGKTCYHQASNIPCPAKGIGDLACSYYGGGKGVVFRYPVEQADTERKMTGVNGKCTFTIKAKDNPNITQTFTASVSLGNTHVIKKDGEYLPTTIQGNVATFEAGSSYVIEVNIITFDAGTNTLDKEFQNYYPKQLDQLEVEAQLDFTIIYENGGKETGTMTQMLKIVDHYNRTFPTALLTTPSAIMITPPGIVTPPEVNLPDITTSSGIEIMPLPEEVSTPLESDERGLSQVEEAILVGIES